MKKLSLPMILALSLIALSTTCAGAAFTIKINPGATLATNNSALAAFNRAANQWASKITDNVTITVNADLGTFSNNNIIGSTSNRELFSDYNSLRNLLVNKHPTDKLLGALPTSAQFSAILPQGVTLSGNLSTSKANLKALGLTSLDTQFGESDGSITFNKAFSFDYDNSNGVSANTIDFETVAAHEIGHLLGFTSSVDDIDSGETSVIPSFMDLYRFSGNNAPTTLAGFSSVTRDLRPGSDAVTATVDKLFTINNVAVNQVRMSTGISKGDGRQASHWKDDQFTGVNIGIMDPSLSFGLRTNVSPNDLIAMRLLGYTLAAPPVTAPEPDAGVLIALGITCAFLIRPKKR